MNIDRRHFLALGAGLVVTRAPLAALPERALSLNNLHTGETLSSVYWAGGRYLEEGVAALAAVLRDHRSGEAGAIAPGLLDLLYALGQSLATPGPIEIISGYRSPASNAWLASNTTGVSWQSLHTRGMAADIRIPGHEVATLRRAALALQAGGVGYYPDSGFVHVDIGRVRSWGG